MMDSTPTPNLPTHRVSITIAGAPGTVVDLLSLHEITRVEPRVYDLRHLERIVRSSRRLLVPAGEPTDPMTRPMERERMHRHGSALRGARSDRKVLLTGMRHPTFIECGGDRLVVELSGLTSDINSVVAIFSSIEKAHGNVAMSLHIGAVGQQVFFRQSPLGDVHS